MTKSTPGFEKINPPPVYEFVFHVLISELSHLKRNARNMLRLHCCYL